MNIINNNRKNTKDEIWDNASILFSNGSHILAGMSLKLKLGPDKKKSLKLLMTGIGGGREKTDKTSLHTAIREFIEEIYGFNPHFFGIKNTSSIIGFEEKPENLEKGIDEVYKMLNTPIYKKVKPWKDSKDNLHASVIYVFTFDDLLNILKYFKSEGLESRLYDEMPVTIDDLLFNRKSDERTEVISLVLLPGTIFINQGDEVLFPQIDTTLGSDLKQFFAQRLKPSIFAQYKGQKYMQLQNRLVSGVNNIVRETNNIEPKKSFAREAFNKNQTINKSKISFRKTRKNFRK